MKKQIIAIAMSAIMITSLASLGSVSKSLFFNTSVVSAASNTEVNVQSFDGKLVYLTTDLNQKSVMDMSLSKADTVHLYGPGTASNKQWKFTLDKATNSYLISNGAFGSTQYLYEQNNKLLLSDPTPSMSNIGDDTRWLIVSIGSGVYEIVNYKTGNRIDVDKAKTGDATPIITYKKSNTKNQYWSFSNVSNDPEAIKYNTNYYLNNTKYKGIKGGATFEAWNNWDYALLANSSTDPGWGIVFEPVDDSNVNGILDWGEKFRIRSRSNNWDGYRWYKTTGNDVILTTQKDAQEFYILQESMSENDIASSPRTGEHLNIGWYYGGDHRRYLTVKNLNSEGKAWLSWAEVFWLSVPNGEWVLSPVN